MKETITMMTAKQAAAIAAKLNISLAGAALNDAIDEHASDGKEFDLIMNAFRQRDPLEDTSKPAPKAKTATKPAPKAKTATKPEPKAKTAKTAKTATKPKGKSRTARMFELVLEGLSNADALAKIKKEYGQDVPTTTASIGWCRSQLHAKTDYAKKHNPKGLKVKTDREAQDAK